MPHMSPMPPEENAPRPDYTEEICALFGGNLTPRILRDRIREYHDNDVAMALPRIPSEERHKLYALLPPDAWADILYYVEEMEVYLDEMSLRQRMDVLTHLDTSLAAAYLRETTRDNRRTILDLMEPTLRAEIALVTSYEEDEIGSRMTTNFISVREGSTVKEAMTALITQAAENDNISTLYVVDEDNTFVGAIELKKLITARENTPLTSITVTSFPYVYAGDAIEECVSRLSEYSEDSIPVLGTDNTIQGVLLSQDIAELVADILGEDYARLAGLPDGEDLHETTTRSVGKRLPWLVILLGLGMFVSSVVGAFEPIVAQLPLIVRFQSLILGMAGNVGTQSLAVTIRVLADEALAGRDKRRLIGKELRVGLVNGLLMGITSLVFIGGYLILASGHPQGEAFAIALCTGLAMLLSILLSSLTGTLIPLMLKRLHIDPAVASGPLISTLNDLAGVLTYYGLAWLLLLRVL